jgi:hypothetical protein
MHAKITLSNSKITAEIFGSLVIFANTHTHTHTHTHLPLNPPALFIKRHKNIKYRRHSISSRYGMSIKNTQDRNRYVSPVVET